jgi:A/G-specific adenine glycosylase
VKDVRAFRRDLLRWFARAKRPLPWRQTRDPYAIWVSETMLQQTTVATVVPYYASFMSRFPDLESLAAAREDEVLALWSGLGYYSRARNLRHAAIQILQSHHGRFPREIETAMMLRGVGRYTASAVTSMAYKTPSAVVDGNVRRVLSRLYAVRDLGEIEALKRAHALLSVRSPGSWNEAMMELGAVVCTPRRPRCEACPVETHCRGRERPEHWSGTKPGRKAVPVMVELALVERGNGILLVRNPQQGLLGGLFELPHSGVPGTGRLSDRHRTLALDSKPAVAFRHTITHHRIEARVFRARLGGRSGIPDASFHSIGEVKTLPLGGLTRKALRALGLLSA